MDDPQDELGEEADQLRHLRRLVVGPTSETIEQLREQVEGRTVDAEEVGDVLPEAIKKSSKKKLSRALAPAFSSAFKESIEKDPQSLVDAISPIMGPAIRRSISQQIQAMVQSLNTALDHSLSPRGIGWRIEAWQTGKPFAEVVLLHTLVYRIEQLFLIDPNTGLLMQCVSADPSNEDADLVSSLLSAIQDFSRDSFGHRTEHESGSDLQSMKTNELNVWIEHGPDAILAAAVRGEPPLTLRQRMQEVLEQLHVQHGPLLSNFRGDTATLEVARFDLEELLDSEYVNQKSEGSAEPEPAKEKNPWLAHLNWLVPACLLLALLVWGFRAQRAKRYARIADVLDVPPNVEFEIADDVLKISGLARHNWLVQANNRIHRLPEFRQLDSSELKFSDEGWVNSLAELRSIPGIMITNAHHDGDEYVLQGLRDPLAPLPGEILKKHGIEQAKVRQSWESYRSMDSQLTIVRLKKHLNFPNGIRLEPGESGTLLIKGTATAGWVRQLQTAIDLLEARGMVDISGIRLLGSSES